MTAPKIDAAIPGRDVVIVLLAAGAIGLFLGLVRHPVWHDALEPAQVLAGLVSYPLDNPVYLFSVRTWTLVNQISALGLAAGLSEWTITFALSGLAGMLALQALGVCVLALARDRALAVASSFFIYATSATAGAVTYPVLLMGTHYSWGMFGLSWAFLGVALLAAGAVRSGAFVLGLALGVHVPSGALVLTAVLVASIADWPSTRQWFPRARWALLAGIGISLAAATIHYAGSALDLRRASGVWVGSAAQFAAYREGHRTPFNLIFGGMVAVWGTVGLAAIWLRWRPSTLTPYARLFLKVLLASAAVGAAGSTIYWLPSRLVPSLLYTLMPSRLMNLNIISAMVLVIGLLAASDRFQARAALAAMIAGVSLACLIDPDRSAWFARAGIGLGGAAILALMWRRPRSDAEPDRRSWVSALVRWTPVAVPALLLAAAILDAAAGFASTRQELRQNDLFFSEMARRRGTVLTAGGLHHIQLRTRRPVLLDGPALDGVVYAPEMIPIASRILRRVYGVEATAGSAPDSITMLSPDEHRVVWQARTAPEWSAIGREFGVTEVLVPNGWTINLREIGRDEGLVAFAIP